MLHFVDPPLQYFPHPVRRKMEFGKLTGEEKSGMPFFDTFAQICQSWILRRK
jgi:hypothetical protein